jgi:hypothetical protein
VLDHASIRLHARQIAEVTGRGYMPPWKPAPADALDNLGPLDERRGEPGEVRQHSERALAARPGWATAMADLAWVLAADPDPAARDPRRALVLAEGAASATKRRDVGVLEALAAACAARGDYARAVSVLEEGLALVDAGAPAERLRRHQAHYRLRLPPALPD